MQNQNHRKKEQKKEQVIQSKGRKKRKYLLSKYFRVNKSSRIKWEGTSKQME